MKSKLFKTVFDAYIQALLNKNQLIELFLEKKRSRSGKVSMPTEELFNNIMQLHFNKNKDSLIKQGQMAKDVKFVPITLNYDRVHEGESFPIELLGEKPIKETFWKVLKKFTVVA